MRIVSFERGDHRSFGILRDDGVTDLGVRCPEDFPSVIELVSGLMDPRVRERVSREGVDYASSEVLLRKPVPHPGKFLCVGVNYMDRNAEYRDGSEPPRYPSLFTRTEDSLVAHGEPLLRPKESAQLDYEGEIGLVMGKGGRRIAEDAALDHIGGITCVNEGSVRDWMRHGKFNVTQGKNFDRSGAVGPWIVTREELDPGASLEVATRVNGEERQKDCTDNLRFPFSRLVSYISSFTTLYPGDMIATGTPTGSGIRFDPPRFLEPGDVVEVEVRGVGVLRNTVRDETP
jgi:5-carboxymethyl-2-hydroxymuconate isomerase